MLTCERLGQTLHHVQRGQALNQNLLQVELPNGCCFIVSFALTILAIFLGPVACFCGRSTEVALPTCRECGVPLSQLGRKGS